MQPSNNHHFQTNRGQPFNQELPLLALAPMQDVTALPFMRVVAHYGSPDLYFTEYFRVHPHSTLEPHILTAITENTTKRPVYAQMIGENIPDLLRTAEALLMHGAAGIDLNMGCPAPRVYKKNVGGGLLREIDRIDAILGALRAHVSANFTVKTRIGFDNWDSFNTLLDCIASHNVDLLSVHGRTVKELYRGEVHYDVIAQAVQKMPCPVLANGNITSANKAVAVIDETRAAGVMIGRSAIRNPWIFRQCKALFAKEPVFIPTLEDVRDYIERLHEALKNEDHSDLQQVSRLKKFLNFVGQSVDPNGSFLYDMRRVNSPKELFKVADHHLLNDPQKPFADEPYEGILARPNCEGELPIKANGTMPCL